METESIRVNCTDVKTGLKNEPEVGRPDLQELIALAVDYIWKLDGAVTSHAIFRKVNSWKPVERREIEDELIAMWEQDLLIRNLDDTYMNMPSKFLLRRASEGSAG
jgi:hypothetical protein